MAGFTQKISLLAAVIISTMPTGYRRANIAFDNGENAIEINEEQLLSIGRDENLLIKYTKPIENEDSQRLLDNESLGSNVNQLPNASQSVKHGDADDIVKEAITGDVITHVDDVDSLADVDTGTTYVNDLDVSSARVDLHLFIGVIDALCAEKILTTAPKCKELTIETELVPGEKTHVTPTAEQRDLAWAWYQENVVIKAVNAIDNDVSEG